MYSLTQCRWQPDTSPGIWEAEDCRPYLERGGAICIAEEQTVRAHERFQLLFIGQLVYVDRDGGVCVYSIAAVCWNKPAVGP